MTRKKASSTLVGEFDPEGGGYDITSARAAGLKRDSRGHMGSVIPATPKQISKGVPKGSFMVLKGRKHSTFHKAVAGERARGFNVKKIGTRYFSVSKTSL
tara:strand:+ start:518 stop:817 length:300 start_codon:yes stop_codon:yes gene_type:complete